MTPEQIAAIQNEAFGGGPMPTASLSSAIAKNEDTFDWQQFLNDHPGVGGNYGTTQDGAWEAYQEGNTSGAVFRAPPFDPNNLVPISSDPNNPSSAIKGYYDPVTEIIYDSNNQNAKMIVPGSIMEDPYFKAIGADDPNKRVDLYNLKQSNPTEFYTQAATNLANNYASGSAMNWQGLSTNGLNKDEIQSNLDNLKNIDPKAYYIGQLTELSKLSGWDYGQNTPERSASRIQQIKDMAPAAIAAGIDPNQLSSLINSNFSDSAQANAAHIAAEASNSQGTLAGLPQFAATAAALGVGLGGLIGAFAPAALASEAAALGTTGAGSIDAYMAGAGLDAGTFGGAEAAGAALNLSSYPGADAILNAPDVQIPGFGTGMPSGASSGITAPLEGSGAIPGAGATTLGEGGLTGALPANVMVGDGTLGTTIGATYMSAGPGQFAVDALGNAIPASSVGIGGFSPSVTSLSDILSTANNIQKAYGLAKNVGNLISGSSASGGTSGGYSSGAGLSSGADTAGASSGALPGNLQANMLAAAPVMQGSSNMNINQLKQLYPQLANLDPRILSSLTGKSSNVPNFYTYGEGQSAGGTALTNQGSGGSPQPGYPSISSSSKAATTGFASPSSSSSGYNALSAAGLNAITTGALPGQSYYKDGGNVHIPQFKTGTTGHFVQGEGDGQSDDIPAMLADGEYVFDADTVAALGNGSSKAGALQLDKMRQAIRKHKRSASVDKIPPKAKSPLEYMKGK